MSIGPLFNFASGYIQSLLGGAINGSSSTSAPASGSTNSSSGAQDGNQLSPFAQILSTFQQLQQSNPSQYQQVTQQISTKLQTAAQAATTAGDTSLANELTQLSTDFSSASSTGQIPNVQDLAQAVGGGHHHHHHGDSASGSSASTSGSTASTANSATTGNLSQYIQSLAASQSGSSVTGSLNPLSIISSTLSSAGIPIV